MLKEISSSEDVLFIGKSASSADFEIEDTEVHDLLLQMIVKLYVTMQGHLYSNSLIEMFFPICIYGPIRVWDVPYAYTHMGRPYAYGTTFCPI